MAGKTSERVNYMLENFMTFHKNDMSIVEIADKCNLSYSTVYMYLSKIAEANGTTRENLLEKPHSPHECRFSITSKKRTANITELKSAINEANNGINEIIDYIELAQEATK